MNINDIVSGMKPQEKEIYFAHMEKRHREEAEYLRAERERMLCYKESLIKDILAWQKNGQFTNDDLAKKDIRTLERIHDYI